MHSKVQHNLGGQSQVITESAGGMSRGVLYQLNLSKRRQEERLRPTNKPLDQDLMLSDKECLALTLREAQQQYDQRCPHIMRVAGSPRNKSLRSRSRSKSPKKKDGNITPRSPKA